MKKLFKQEKGFTLLEVLISMSILSIVVIGMMSFFSNSFSYVKENESKTIATQIVRNMMNYMENQDFSKMEGYFHYVRDPDNYSFLAELDQSFCNQPVTIETKGISSPSERIMIENVALFDNRDRCHSIFNPIINNEAYNNDSISVYLMKYNEAEDMDAIKELIEQNNPAIADLPNSLKKAIGNFEKDSALFEPNEFVQEHLLRVFVVLAWKENRDDVVIQGVLSHETIR